MRAIGSTAVCGLVLASCSLLVHFDRSAIPGEGGADAVSDVPPGGYVNEAGMACTCVPNEFQTINGGWAVVSSQYGPVGCSVPYTTPTNYDEITSIGGAGSCGCSCTPPNVTCTPDNNLNVTITTGTTNACNDGDTRNYSVNGASCAPGCCDLSNCDYVKVSGATATASNGTCTPQGTVNLPAASNKTTVCSFAGEIDTCPSGVCIPTPGQYVGLCVSHADEPGLTCPSGFPEMHRLGTLRDNRACPSCTCDTQAKCTAFAAMLYGTNTCNMKDFVATVPADGTCNKTPMVCVNNALPVRGITISAMPSVSCTPSYAMTSPTGSVGLDNAMVVCCLHIPLGS